MMRDGMAVQEDTSEFLNGLLTALEHISLCQAGGAGAFDARSRVCSCILFLHPACQQQAEGLARQAQLLLT